MNQKLRKKEEICRSCGYPIKDDCGHGYCNDTTCHLECPECDEHDPVYDFVNRELMRKGFHEFYD